MKVLVNALARFAFSKSSRDLKHLRRVRQSLKSPSAEGEISYTAANSRSDLFLLCANLRQQFAAKRSLNFFLCASGVKEIPIPPAARSQMKTT